MSASSSLSCGQFEKKGEVGLNGRQAYEVIGQTSVNWPKIGISDLRTLY